MIALLAIVFGFGLIVGLHEAAHMLVSKYFGVEVYRFSIGFGPLLFAKKIGETSYELRLLPLGGYVQCAGENPGEKVERGFFSLVWHKRLIIALVGPCMNLVLGFLIILGLFLVNHWPLGPAIVKTFDMVKMFFSLTFQWMLGLFNHTSKITDLAGPVTVTKIMVQSLRENFMQFCFMIAIVSLNLGIFNLFPLPGLDGGHVFLYILEGLWRKPFSSKVYQVWALLSIVLLLSLMLFVVGMDIWKLFFLKS